jgi:hypothetical protein
MIPVCGAHFIEVGSPDPVLGKPLAGETAVLDLIENAAHFGAGVRTG